MSPLLRRLPVPVAPFPTETVGSYVTRLALANHLERATLDGLLREPGISRGPADLRRLTAATGKSSFVLQHALSELGPRRLWLRGEVPRLACRLCVAAQGISGRVSVRAPGHRDVCLRHRRWTGPTVRRLEEQYDLSHLPEILVAANRHHRLVRQHGLVEARRAYQDALEVNLGWALLGWWCRHRDQRLRQLPGGPARLIGDPALHAAVYPETVRLACVMVSPHWTAVAASADVSDREPFYAEVARRLDLSEYRPSVGDPLARWVAREARLGIAQCE
jgi:hypothetical protein